MYLFIGDIVFTKISLAHGYLFISDTAFTNHPVSGV